MTRPFTLLVAAALLLLASTLSIRPAEAQRRGGGFGGGRSFSRPSFSRSPFSSRPSARPPSTFSSPQPALPPPVAVPPTPALPRANGGFGSGRATGIAGAPNAPPVAASVPASGGFGRGEARGVAGATANKPISSAPPAPAATSSARSGPIISSNPAPAPAVPGNVYRDFRRVEPVRGSPNVYVYDRRPTWGFLPFWWYPPIYTPTGMMVSRGGPNPLAIFLTLAAVVLLVVVGVALFRRRAQAR